jgi:hypothetical protein
MFNNIYLTAIGSSPGGSGFCHFVWCFDFQVVGKAAARNPDT